MLWCVCKRCYCVSWFHAPWYWGLLALWLSPSLERFCSRPPGPFRYLKMFR